MNPKETLRLACPQCSGTVRVAATYAGKRIECPKCGGVMKVPGVSSAQEERDDWLSLDDPPTPPQNGDRSGNARPISADLPGWSITSTAAVDSPSPKRDALVSSPSSSAKKSAAVVPVDNPDWLEGLPPLAAEPPGERSPQSTTAADRGLAQGFSDSERAALAAAAGLDPLNFDSVSITNEFDDDDSLPTPKLINADSKEEFRAKCPVCESIHYVQHNMIGKEIRCGDCHSLFPVSKPKLKAGAVKPKIDIKNAATFQLSGADQSNPSVPAPWQKSAADYLRQAEDAASEEVEDDPRKLMDTPQIGEWLQGIFGIFTVPSVLVNWLILSAIGAIPVFLLLFLPGQYYGSTALFFAVFFCLYAATAAFSILESIANNQEIGVQSPALLPFKGSTKGLIGGITLLIAATPGALFGGLLLGVHILSLATTMLSVFVLFPYLLLSILDNDSIFAPVSTRVTKSFNRCREAWGGFYFSAMLLFATLYLGLVFTSGVLPVVLGLVMNSFLLSTAIFAYFSMLGHLAFKIGHAVTPRTEQ